MCNGKKGGFSMKKRYVFLLAAVLFCLMLPGAAGAEKQIYTDFEIHIGSGETLMPAYPDFSSQIGKGLTRDDFIITYANDGSNRFFDEEGRCTALCESSGSYMYFSMIYTPKKAGVGEKTTFYGKMYVYEPMEEITFPEGWKKVMLSEGEGCSLEVETSRYAYQSLEIINSNEAVVGASLLYQYNNRWMLVLNEKAEGEATITIRAYNGLEKVLPVTVTNPPTKVAFGAEKFMGYVGDVVDLGLDLGGATTLLRYMNLRSNSQEVNARDYLPGWNRQEWGLFHALKSGLFELTLETYNGHSGSVAVEVYDTEPVRDIQISSGTVNEGAAVEVKLLSAEGKVLHAPLRITEGSDLVRLNGGKPYQLAALAPGLVQMEVENRDGSVIRKELEVAAQPDKTFLNVETLEMDIGDTFDLSVSFDQGQTDYWYQVEYDEKTPENGLKCIRLEGDRLIAQAPGSATIRVVSSALENASCKVTVKEGEKEISIRLPEEYLGLNHTWQLKVVDKAGQEYPATFRCVSNSGNTISQDGVITGKWVGKVTVYAALSDGREISTQVQVVTKPLWLKHEDVSCYVDDASALVYLESDVGLGLPSLSEVEITVSDETIAAYQGGKLVPKAPGKTHVSVKAKYSDAECVFILTVKERNELETQYNQVDVPAGYSLRLPQVTDLQGNVIEVTWEMTYHVPGPGNPDNVGFRLEGDVLSCLWPSAVCEVTGTASFGGQVKINAKGYRLAEEIRFLQDEYVMPKHDRRMLKVEAVQDENGYGACKTGQLMWMVEDETIVQLEQNNQNDYQWIRALRHGQTKVYAISVSGVVAECTVTVDRTRVDAGDVNADNYIDSQDTTLLLRYLADWGVDVYFDGAEVTGNEVINAGDALRLLRYVKNWDVPLR